MKTLTLAFASFAMLVACSHQDDSVDSSGADLAAVSASNVVGEIDVGQTQSLPYDPSTQNVLHFAARTGDSLSITAVDQHDANDQPLISLIDHNGVVIGHGDADITQSEDVYIFVRPTVFRPTTFKVTLQGTRAPTGFQYPGWASGNTLPLNLICTIEPSDIPTGGVYYSKMQFQLDGSLSIHPRDASGLTQVATWNGPPSFDDGGSSEIHDGYNLLTGAGENPSAFALLESQQPTDSVDIKETSTNLSVSWTTTYEDGNGVYHPNAMATVGVTSSGMSVMFQSSLPWDDGQDDVKLLVSCNGKIAPTQ